MLDFPPLSKTCSVCSELSQVQLAQVWQKQESDWSLRLSQSFPNSSLHLQLPGGLDDNLWSLLLLLGWLGWDFPLVFLSLTVRDGSGIVLGKSRTGREVPELRNQDSFYTVPFLTPHCSTAQKDKITLPFFGLVALIQYSHAEVGLSEP